MEDEMNVMEVLQHDALDSLEDVVAQMRAVDLVGCAVLADDTDTPQSAFIDLLLPLMRQWRNKIELAVPLFEGNEAERG